MRNILVTENDIKNGQGLGLLPIVESANRDTYNPSPTQELGLEMSFSSHSHLTEVIE